MSELCAFSYTHWSLKAEAKQTAMVSVIINYNNAILVYQIWHTSCYGLFVCKVVTLVRGGESTVLEGYLHPYMYNCFFFINFHIFQMCIIYMSLYCGYISLESKCNITNITVLKYFITWFYIVVNFSCPLRLWTHFPVPRELAGSCFVD